MAELPGDDETAEWEARREARVEQPDEPAPEGEATPASLLLPLQPLMPFDATAIPFGLEDYPAEQK